MRRESYGVMDTGRVTRLDVNVSSSVQYLREKKEVRLFGERLGLCKCAEACPENSMKAASDFLLLSNRKKEGK